MRENFTFSNRHLDLMGRDAESVLGWRYQPRIIFCRGRGVLITDVDGNDYYDMSSGMMSLVLGHSHPELTETIREQAERFVHESSWYSNPWAIEFAELIGSTLPGDLSVVNFAVTGSEANEVAMRMAISATGRFDIVSVIRGLHGGSLAVEALTTVGGGRRRGLGPLMIPAKANAILPPFCYRCPVNLEYPSCDVACLGSSEDLLEHLTSKDVAAIMAEPMMVAGGMIVPPAEWLPRLKEMAARWGGLLVLDEAQLAPGRTGALWGFEHSDVAPDIVTFAKGMTAGMAICGAVTTPEIAERAAGNLGVPWSGTYPGDPLPAAVALKSLQIVLRDNLTGRARDLGGFLRRRLDGLRDRFDCIGDVRGRGLYQMLDIVTGKDAKTPDPAMAERIRYNAMLAGAAFICVKNFIRVCPPLIITEAQLDDVIGRLETAIERSVEGHPGDIDFTASSSLAAAGGPPRVA
ncbi:MAG: aspartate aminotransferase family protein [Rhodospirillales bacterium]